MSFFFSTQVYCCVANQPTLTDLKQQPFMISHDSMGSAEAGASLSCLGLWCWRSAGAPRSLCAASHASPLEGWLPRGIVTMWSMHLVKASPKASPDSRNRLHLFTGGQQALTGMERVLAAICSKPPCCGCIVLLTLMPSATCQAMAEHLQVLPHSVFSSSLRCLLNR